jgi:glycosyltransferase involved in cell wall biosynthesis
VAQPRRIAFYSTVRGYTWGAPDVLWTAAAHRLRLAGHEVFAVVSPLACQHPKVLELATAGARLALVPRIGPGGNFQSLRRKLRGWLEGSHHTLAELESFRPEMVFINQGGFADFLLEDDLRASLTHARTPYVVLCHSIREEESFSPDHARQAHEFLAGARGVLANSRHVLELGGRQLGATLTNTAVFQNPVSVPAELPLPWPRTTAPAFAFVGRLDLLGKGLDLLMEALVTSPGLKEEWQLNLYGDGPDRARIAECAAAHGLTERIRFHGRVSDLAAIWRENHLLVLPSRFEGFGLVMLEALLCGRPVLRTNLGGVAEWMRNGENGFVCPAIDARSLAATLARAWSARGNWEAMGRTAHRLAAAVYDPHPEEKLLALAGL